jgi:putative inorganic carbon (HCO3(-)) transporter
MISQPTVSQRLRSAAGRVGGLEAGIVILASPLLLFPTFRPAWTAGALVALLLVWLARWAGAGHPGAITPLNISLLVLLMMVPVAVWTSALPELTLPKLTGLVLGVAAFRATVHAVRRARHLAVATGLYVLLGLALTAMGLVSAAWLQKWPMLDPLLAHIPRLIESLPGAKAGIHPNELAGALLLFLPVSLAGVGRQGSRRGWLDPVVRLVPLLIALFFGAVLALTQSRSAWIGVAAGLGAMAWLRWRWARWLLLAAVLLLALALAYVGPQAAMQAIFQSADLPAAGTMLSTVNLQGRIQIWNRALYAIQDFPLTGCGLGTFRRVVQVFYPLFLVGPDFDIGHAHNVFLQVALDVGLPGLIAYLALVGTALWIGWRVARSPDRDYRWLGLGIVGALVGFHAYGLTDTIALGAKPGVALWVLLALAAALWDVAQGMAQPPAARPGPLGSEST